jgi:hypothetical protein
VSKERGYLHSGFSAEPRVIRKRTRELGEEERRKVVWEKERRGEW